MSTLYFHSPEGRAELRGSEWHHMKVSVADWFVSALNIPASFDRTSRFFELIPKDSYLQNYFKTLTPDNWHQFFQFLQAWVRSTCADNYLVVGDYKISLPATRLNTAYLMGSDILKLMVRLQSQGELHCYIEPQNREWLARIIEAGLSTAIYRHNQGWQSVVALLRNGHNSPVVTSYSVCLPFPNPRVANFDLGDNEEENEELWYSLTHEDQWNLGMQGLRSNPGCRLELTPDFWGEFYFSHGWDAFKINHLLTLPSSKWSELVKAFDEVQLSVSESWVYALNAVA